jgi:hypothetical protein
MWSNWFTKWTPRRKRRLPACRRRHSCPLVLEDLEARNLLSFFGPRNYDAGTKPLDVAVADLTGNGIPDIVTANDSTPSVNVLLGNGDGTFQAPQPIGNDPNAAAVVIGDFNGDGIPDIATANFDGNVRVYLGNGDGTFQSARVSTGSNLPRSLVAADFTGTGVLDLAETSLTGPIILLGNGDGTFQAPRSLGVNGSYLAVADLTGDGIPDLAVANPGNPFLMDLGNVSALLGNGDGTFQPARTFSAGNYPNSVVVGDFTGDGIPDLAVTNYGASAGTGGISILLGNGDGTFQAATSLFVGQNIVSLAVGDFNSDGFSDLAAVPEFISSGTLQPGVVIFLAKGDGTFQAPTSYVVGNSPQAIAVADLNGDGALDCVLADYGASSVEVRLGNGDGTFQALTNEAAGPSPMALTLGDFNGDGIPDLAVANEVPNGTVSVLLGNGDGTLAPAVSYPTGPDPYRLVMGDFDGDGTLDLITLNGNNTASVLLGNGDGSFRSPRSFAIDAGVTAVAAADLTGDGVLDLVLVVGGSVNSTVEVLRGNGDGSFGPPVRYTGIGPGAGSVAVGDLNGDHVPDLVVGYVGTFRPPRPGGLDVLLGNGDGTFRPPTNYSGFGSVDFVNLGDFNGDGFLDIVTGNGVLLNHGDGTFGPPIFYESANAYTVAVGDFNGDGRLDLAVSDASNGIRVLLGNGDGTFRLDHIYAAGRAPDNLVVGDLNGDGLPDIVTANFDSNDISVLLNAADWGPHGQGAPALSRRSAYTADAALADNFWSSLDDDGGWEAWPVAPPKRPSMARLFRPPESTAATVVLGANRAVCLGPW